MRCPSFEESMSSIVGNLKNAPPSESPTSAVPCAVGFYFAFRTMAVLVSVRIFGAEPQTGTGINIAVDFSLLLVTAFCSVGNARYPFRQIAKLPGVRWALLFLGFSCCSLLWSSAASLTNSIAYWCAMAADFMIVAMLLRTGPLTEVSSSLMRGFIWGACAVALVAWLMPAQSDLRLGDEELLGANQIGYVCAFAFFFAQHLMRMKKGNWGAPALLLAITLLRTISKTTIAAFVVGEGFLDKNPRCSHRRRDSCRIFGTVGLLL
jgi:exopolysaccharide production protein ExoQ